MSKKGTNEEKRGKFLKFLVLFLVFVATIILLCVYVFDIKVKAIIIHGNDVVKDSEILQIADIEDYPNFFLANDKVIKKKLESDSFIKSVKIRRNAFLQMHIYVTENKPIFIREDTNMIVFDEENEVSNDRNLVLDIPYLINYVPNTKYKKFIEKIGQVDYNLFKKVSQIKYAPTKYDEDRFILYMNDSNRVYINIPKFKSFNKYDEMVTKFEGKTGTLYLDSGNYFEIDKK